MAEDMTQRRDGESALQYHRRLVYGKLVDKTIDLDYSELSELVYGQPYSSDVSRRMMYGSRRTLELMDADRDNRIEESGLPEVREKIAEADNKISELREITQQYRDQRREFNKLASVTARESHLYDMLIESANHLERTVGCLYEDMPAIDMPRTESEAVLVFADWHYGMTASNVFNEYDTEICRNRVHKIVREAVQRIGLHGCRRLHIVVLGDLFHGAIHNSARVASEELVCDQIMQSSEILAQSIEYLAQFVDETVVYMTYGNHARTIQNKSDSIHRDNMERLVPWWLEQRFRSHNNITIAPESDTEFIFVNTCGHEICAAHGDNDSVKTSPRLLTSLFQKRYGKNIEYILLGDKHHRESYDEVGTTAIMCGSLCGTDDYSNDKRLYSEPSQLLLITNKECGVDAEYRLNCR